RKQRTRQHVIADQSVHHVEGFILDEGHTAERFGYDYGYDLLMKTFDDQGYVEPGRVYFQVKASEHLSEVKRFYVFDVDIRDYNLWMSEQTLVILVLYDATRRVAYWLAVKHYFLGGPPRSPRPHAKWVGVRIPKNQRITQQTIAESRRLKLKQTSG